MDPGAFEARSLGYFVGFIRIHLGSNGGMGANFGTPYGSGSQLIFLLSTI
jgi:hypothetical protein